MKRVKYFILIATAMTLAFTSCKKDKDKDSSTREYLNGSVSFSLTKYIGVDKKVTVTPSGVTKPNGEGVVGYYWRTSWGNANDTTRVENGDGDGSFTFTTPSSSGEYTVTCTAFAEEYYTSSNTETIFAINPALDSAVTGLGFKGKPKFTDKRDGTDYYISDYAGKSWFMNNLAYAGSGISYENSSIMDMVFGRFYTWNEAQEACPEGWRLPTEEDFVAMANAIAGQEGKFKATEEFKDVAGGMMVNAYFLGERMWEYWPKVKITNVSGFSALSTGYQSAKFSGLNKYATFWTADEADEDRGIARYIYVEDPDVHVGRYDKDSFRASVRCVKDN